MHYHPLTEEDKAEMMNEIGVRSFADLLKTIPAELRDPRLDIPEALSELEIQDLMRALADKNITVKKFLSFLGAGSYDHYIPSALPQIIGRQEFYTAYTPYQPEASQGSLQAIFEYQSLITELTGLDVSNASHYDGSTSLAEAALLALRHTERTTILIARSAHPHYRHVLNTYLDGTLFKIIEIGFNESGQFDRAELGKKLDRNVAAVIFQTPNFFGVIEDLSGVAEQIHAAGALLIMTSNPLSLGVLRSPGEWGADIAVGEGQPLGIPMQFGGPYLGYFATTRELMRRIPGRLAGMTQDSEGKRAYCLTLQAREQHIRRERAASNICTNQALCALAACVYMTLLGKSGIKEIGEINMDRSGYLRERIASLGQFRVNTRVPIFNEFVVKSDKNYRDIQEKLSRDKVLPGVDLEQFYPEMKNQFLVCATETKTKNDLDQFVEALSQC